MNNSLATAWRLSGRAGGEVLPRQIVELLAAGLLAECAAPEPRHEPISLTELERPEPGLFS